MLMCDTSGDYAFLPNRLCARRILCFLKRHLLEGAAHQLERETTVFFDLCHLQFLAGSARFDELTSYVSRFMDSHRTEPAPPPSRQAALFLEVLHVYRVLGMIAAGGKHAEGVDLLFPLLDEAAAKADPRTAAMRTFFHKMRQHPPRDFSGWIPIWNSAAERLKNLALKCPELKGKLHLPYTAPKRWQINLSGVRPVPRPYKKVKKQNACDIACFFKAKSQEIKKSTSGISSNGTSNSMLSDMQTELAVPQAPAAIVGGRTLGGDERLASEAALASGNQALESGSLGGDKRLASEAALTTGASEDASKSKKRKMTLDTEADP
ncbi:hypothetical protein ACP70R_027385 [Stipagrostis hirtigluma subsp. patula]